MEYRIVGLLGRKIFKRITLSIDPSWRFIHYSIIPLFHRSGSVKLFI